MAAKDTAKMQPKPAETNGKRSIIVVFSYNKTLIDSTKAVTFAERVEVVAKGEGSKMIETQTRKINLPARFKDQ